MNETPTAVLDQAAFQRVWRRVMPQDRADCPFTLAEPALTPTSAPQALVPSPPAPVAAQAAPQAIPCLGEASVGELPVLESLIQGAAQALRQYRVLERRTGRRGSFSALIKGKERQVRRLSAAYFLISGKEYALPSGEAAGLPQANALALRERFRGEQVEAATLMDAARVTGDPCLAQLYRELAEENRGFADTVRARLEKR